jgi:DNA-binding MarR family transcriptional regulator
MQHNYRANAVAHAMYEGCLGVRVGRLHRLISRRFDQQLRPLGLSISQLEMLSALTIVDAAVKPTHLAELLGTERSTISRNLSVLEAKDLIATAEASATGRSMAVAITPAGTEMLARAEKAWRAAQSALTELLGDDAPALLDTWLAQLAES